MQNVNRQKKVNGIGWFFLITVIVHVGFSLLLSFAVDMGINISIEVQLIFSELTLLVPTLIYILKNKLSFTEDLGFRKIKVGTIFMVLLVTMLISPFITFVNLASQLFVPNTMLESSSELLSGSTFVVWFLASVYGPFVEELGFRGVVGKTLGKASGLIKGVLMSSLLFALMHLNINQACYAFVLGVIFSIVNIATGSIVSSMIMHMAVNGWNMLLMIVSTKVMEAAGMSEQLSEVGEVARNSSIMYVYIGVFLIMGIIGLALAIPCVGWISKHEGNADKLKVLFVKNNKGKSEDKEDSEHVRVLVNVPMILSIIVVLFIMFGLSPLLAMFGFK